MSQKKHKKIRKIQTAGVMTDEVSAELGLTFWGVVKSHWKYLLILVLGTILLYLNGQNGNFVSDDYATIPQNTQIFDLSHQIGKQSGLLSLAALSNWAMAVVFGNQNPFPYHLFNLFMYVWILLIGFVILKILTGERVAIISTLIFATMPIHVEGITWISGKPYPFNTLFVSWALLLTILWLKTKRKYYMYFLLGLLPFVFFADKVRSFSYLLIIPLLFVSFRSMFVKHIPWKKILVPSIVLATLGLIYLVPKIIERVNVVNGGYNASESVFYNPLFQYPTAMTKYLQLMWFPIDLTLYHTMYTFPVWLNWAVLISYLVAVGYFFFKNKKMFFALSFIFVAAAPSMAPVKVSWLVAERYMFLGSWGFAMLLGLIFEDSGKYLKIVTPVFLTCYLIFSVLRTFIRNGDWTTNHKLWVNTCQVSPNSHNAWNNIGDDYDKLADYENAIKGFTQSVVVKPNYADAYHNRANIFFKVGRLDMARESYGVALSFSPSLFQTYLSLTQIDLMEKKYDLALSHASKALEYQPNNPQNIYVLGVVYTNMGQLDQAKKIFTALLQSYPDYKLASEALREVNAMMSKT